MNRYIKLRRSNILKKAFIVVLITIFVILFFLRWTGYITNTPLNWKRPNVEYIDSRENSLIQKNDQLWINLRFNKNHANIKNAYVWVDDKDNRKDLQPNSNTYIFKNLESGDHEIGYELDWSLFGHKEESTIFNMSNLNTVILEDLDRSESDLNVRLKVEGDFVGDTLGLYYLDVNSYKKNKALGINDFLVKQADLNSDENTLTLDSVIDSDGNELKFIDYPNERYLLFGGGMTQIEGKTYLVYSLPFYGYVWGVPSIYSISSSVNEKNGTVTISGIGINENNFDNEGQEWLQFDFLYKDGADWKIADQKLIEYEAFRKNGLNFQNILRDETYFPTPSDHNEWLDYGVRVQLKYGYNLNDTPQIDDTPPKSSNVFTQEFGFRPQQVVIDDVFSYEQPNYYYDYNSSGQFEQVIINWDEGEWIDLPDKNARISVKWRAKTMDGVVKQDWEVLNQMDGILPTALNGQTIIDSSFSNVIDPIQSTIIELKIDVKIPIINWWNEIVDYNVVPLKLNNITIKNK